MQPFNAIVDSKITVRLPSTEIEGLKSSRVNCSISPVLQRQDQVLALKNGLNRLNRESGTFTHYDVKDGVVLRMAGVYQKLSISKKP